MRLRPYQNKAVEAVFDEWRTHQATLIVQPTGTGKTVTFAHVIAKQTGGRAMVLAHREELIFQAARKIAAVTGQQPEIEMAEMRAGPPEARGLFDRPSVVISSIQTQCAGENGNGRMTRFDPSEFSLLVVDEAHHATAPTYRRVLDYYCRNPELRVLGVTATPDRADEAALGQVFQSVAFDYEITDAIADGWLVPVMQRAVTVDGLDYSSVRTTAGDLNGADLARVMEYEESLHGIASPTLELIGDRRTLVFAASLAHAERMTEIFNRHRADMARWVHGGTPKEERRELLRDYSAGRFQVLVNVGVATEGFDEPGIAVVVMARPTKSRALYAQMAGRGMRPAEAIARALNDYADPADRRRLIAESGKPSCEIVDFVGNSGRHKLMTTADILGGNYDDVVIERARQAAEKSGRPVDMTEALVQAERDIEEERIRARRAALRMRASYKVDLVNPFDVLQIAPPRVRGWDTGEPASDKQIDLLERMGVPTEGINRREASRLIDAVIGRRKKDQCTYKQARLLARYGYRTDVSFSEAKGIIDALARNHWRPVDVPQQARAEEVTVY
ncbi:MAG: DEAD/DEAH box helicase [Planctomycetes bacterium]|nr:DEAD/DEAH box helicase [Planctomycetota bacterium]